MDYSTLQAVVILFSAFAGVIVTLWPPSDPKLKLLVVFVFLVLGVVAIWLQRQKESIDKTDMTKAQDQLLNWQRGDPKNPPRFGHLISVNPANGAATFRITMENDSDYPAYDISGRLWNLDTVPPNPASLEDLLRNDLVTVNISSLSGHVVQILGTIEIPATESSKRFAAQYTTRTGGFGQKYRAVRVNGNWLFATQVTRSDVSGDVVFERVDPGFPRNEAGLVDWSMKP